MKWIASASARKSTSATRLYRCPTSDPRPHGQRRTTASGTHTLSGNAGIVFGKMESMSEQHDQRIIRDCPKRTLQHTRQASFHTVLAADHGRPGRFVVVGLIGEQSIAQTVEHGLKVRLDQRVASLTGKPPRQVIQPVGFFANGFARHRHQACKELAG